MAVSRRIRLGGSIGTLSPTEGKFRVKGDGVLAMACTAIYLPDATKVEQGGAFQAFATCSRTLAAFFAWQNDCDYGQCILTKPPFTGRIGCRIDRLKGQADIQGTAPDDDPV
ncbi:hypothetical protein ACFIOY_11545 [Bradyrhizobium sp. TZ2]